MPDQPSAQWEPKNVLKRLRKATASGQSASAQVFVNDGRRAFFNNFLMPSLQRAFALAQINHLAEAVADQLNLDVARALDEFFDIDR